jgi:hypothetical protein
LKRQRICIKRLKSQRRKILSCSKADLSDFPVWLRITGNPYYPHFIREVGSKKRGSKYPKETFLDFMRLKKDGLSYEQISEEMGIGVWKCKYLQRRITELRMEGTNFEQD